MKKITSLIDILSARAEKSPERVIYRFLEYKNGKWEMQNITMRSLYHKSLEIAYALRIKDCVAATGQSSSVCRTTAQLMRFWAV